MSGDSPRFGYALLVVCLLVVCLSADALRAQDAEPESPQPIRYRRIFLFENQAATLIPRDYRPVAADLLEELLAAQRRKADQLNDSKPRLNRVMYRVSYDPRTMSLQSKQTTLDIAYSGEQPTRLDLGRVNWALTAPSLSGDDSQQKTRWLTSDSGNSVVALRGDSQLDVAWSLAGVELPDQAVRWNLQIPRCARSQMLIDLPAGFTLSIDNGVLRELTSAPPESGLATEEGSRRWYRLELGGLSEIEMTVTPQTSAADHPPLVIRRQSLTYRVGKRTTQWTAQMTLEAVPGTALPSMRLGSGRLTEVQLKNQTVSWKEITEPNALTLQFLSPVPGPRSSIAGPIELTIRGFLNHDASGSFPLPWPEFTDRRVIIATPVVQAQIQTDPTITLAHLKIPTNWRLRPTVVSENGARTLVMEGDVTEDFVPPSIQLTGAPNAIPANAALRLSVEDRAIRARWDATLAVGDQLGPLRLAFERNWRIDSLLLADSGRLIELPSNQRSITIWPEPADLKGGQLRIRATGERLPRPSERDASRTIPATWFARLNDCRTESVAAIAPPQSFRWAAGTVLRGPLLQRSDLSSEMLELLGPVGDGSLLFRLPYDTTPMLELERPLPTIDASVLLEVTGDADEVSELLTLTCKSPSATATQLLLRCGEYQGRPALTWSLAKGAGSGWSLPRLQASSEEDEETWLVSLPPGQRGDLQLTARRRYAIGDSQAIDLPSITQVSSDETLASISVNQKLKAIVGAGLHLAGTSGPVQRVPGIAVDGEARPLRYQPNAPASIEISGRLALLSPAVLWEEAVDVIASARWGDTVIARYETDGHQPLQIEHSLGLRLTEGRVNGQPIDVDAVTSALGQIQVPGLGVPSRVMLRFDHVEAYSGFFRMWSPPELRAAGVVLKRNWRMWPAIDSFAPAATHVRLASDPSDSLLADDDLLTAMADRSQRIAITDLKTEQLLISAELAWGIAGVVSLLVFAFCWMLARRSLSAVLLCVLWMLTGAMGWPDWFFVIVGFVMTPAIAAALMAIALRQPSDVFLEQPRGTSELDFSFVRASVTIFIAWVTLLASGLTATAQQPPADTAEAGSDLAEATDSVSKDAFPILIPLTADGEFAGSRVYVPEKLYGQLFRPSNGDASPASVFLRRVDYRMRTNGVTDMTSTVKLEARIELETDAIERPVRLPFPAASVREVDILSGGLSRSVRWLPNDNAISLQLPKAGLTTLRLILDVPISVDEYGVQSVDFPIPRVSSSTLGFDADATLDRLVAPTCLGKSNADLVMGELTADLGPAETLSVQWRVARSQSEAQSPPLVRRFLLQASPAKLVTECLMDVSTIVQDRSELVELDFGNAAPPAVLSPAWSVVRDSEDTDPSSGRLRLRCNDRGLPPIRLIWETRTTDLPTDSKDPKLRVYSLPPVQLVGRTMLGPTFIALNKQAGQTLRLDDPRQAVAMPIDRFLAGWNSNVDVIEQVVVAEDVMPKLVLSTAQPRPWQVEQTQQLLVRMEAPIGPAQLLLDYQAIVRPGEGSSRPMHLTIPNGIRIHNVSVAGSSVAAPVQRAGTVSELVLPELSVSEPYRVRFRGSLDAPANGRFSPPLVRLVGIENLGGVYSIARGAGVAIAERTPTTLSVSTQTIPTSERLAQSIVPQWAWQLSPDNMQATRGRLEGQYEVTVNEAETATLQLTNLAFDAGRWTMETIINMRPVRGRIDFVTVEIPSRWGEDLTVSNAESWSIQPAADPSKRLIRILPADSTKARRELRIRSRLVGGDLSQVSVPEIRVLGAGTRRLFVSVPRAMESTEVAWEATGTRRGQEPLELKAYLPAASTHQTFEVGGAWSVKMVTTSKTPAQAAASVMDVQIFAQRERPSLIVCRWDLFPAGRRAVQIHIPPSFQPLGQWSAGMPVPLEQQGRVVKLPLSLSRLAQPVVLLGQYTPNNNSFVSLPKILDIPVQQTWVTRLEAEPYGGTVDVPKPWQPSTQPARAEALARSVLTALDDSRDSLANRPSEEVGAWLAPWLSRFRKLTPTALPSSDSDTPADSESTPSTRSAAPIATNETTPAVPSEMETRMTDYLNSVLGANEISTGETEPSPLVPIGWTIGQTETTPGAAANLPVAFLHGAQPVAESQLRLAGMLLLGLLFAVAVLQFRDRLQPLLASAAFWLFAIGLIGFILAPLPVAIAVCLVAVSAPKLRRTTPKHP